MVSPKNNNINTTIILNKNISSFLKIRKDRTKTTSIGNTNKKVI